MTDVVILPGVKRIPDNCFFFCRELRRIKLPDGLTSIGEWAFSRCYRLTELVIPSSVDVIPEGMASYCGGLKYVLIGDGVKEIGRDAFEYCEELAMVTIPQSVKSIAFGSFCNCKSLTAIIYAGTMEQWLAMERDKDWARGSGNFSISCVDGVIDK